MREVLEGSWVNALIVVMDYFFRTICSIGSGHSNKQHHVPRDLEGRNLIRIDES